MSISDKHHFRVQDFVFKGTAMGTAYERVPPPKQPPGPPVLWLMNHYLFHRHWSDYFDYPNPRRERGRKVTRPTNKQVRYTEHRERIPSVEKSPAQHVR